MLSRDRQTSNNCVASKFTIEVYVKHNTYFNGQVQSLGFTRVDGLRLTVGVVEPGKHDFGVAECKEVIEIVTSGVLRINGTDYGYREYCEIPVGTKIIIEAVGAVGYSCAYFD